jgi:hypothetical protein
MEDLYSEVYEYLKIYYPNKDINIDNVKGSLKRYDDVLKSLIPPCVPENLHKYINTAHMIHDMYQNEQILIFRFDPDDTSSTCSEEYEEAEHVNGFINGVKILDDVDIREQITANEYSGGFWNGEIHWVYYF